jgi:hypothetical protein
MFVYLLCISSLRILPIVTCRLKKAAAPRLLLLCTLVHCLLSLLPLPAFATDEHYLERLLDTAHSRKLSEDRTWQVLLHYTKTLSGGLKSRIDDPKFFLSPGGRTDSRAELDAALKSLFLTDPKDGEYFACRFPARFDWLNSRLDLDPSKLPTYSCSEKDKALASVEAKSAVLVFPVGHVNSPASMFGHTLLRIDGSSRSNLISFAVNYSATATDSNGFLYAFKGLTGMYKGYYSMMPYYAKVKEYNDLEHRDMWEYRLKLSEAEVAKMLKHVWELQNISSSYYFLDENCSYNLLFLIEAARPELHLTEKTGLFVLPTQTIRIAQQNGILEEAHYRPSQGTRIRSILAKLDLESQQAAMELAYPDKPGKAAEEKTPAAAEKIKVLDLAAEFVQFRYARKELEKDPYNKLYLKLLRERSTLGAAPEGMYDIAEPAKPETGHESSKVALGAGFRRAEPFGELELQPVFHSLLDPDQGYLKGAQIKFLDTVLRFGDRPSPVTLYSLHLLDILSVTPRDIFFKPLSWKVNLGLDTEPMRNGRDQLIFRLNTGGGLSYATPFGGVWYGFGEIDINAGDKIRAGVTAGPGVSIGEAEQITDWWKLNLGAKTFLYKLGDDRFTVKLTAAQNFRITRNNSLSVDYSHEFVQGHQIGETGVLWNYYF